MLLLILVLRASFAAFIFAALLVKALSFLINPLLFTLGEFALEGPLTGFFSIVVNQPVLALLDLHRYVVAGGILFTLICSVFCYPLLYFLTQKYRKTVLHWTETSPSFARFARFPLVRFFTWLFMGKKKGDYQETMEAKRSPVRKGVVVLLVSFLLVAWVFSLLFGDGLAKAGFESGLSRAMDADVTTRDLTLSLLRGSLALEEFVVYERDEKKGIVKALKFTGDLSMHALLKRHLVFDEIKIENMDFKVDRDAEGRLSLDQKQRPDQKDDKEKEAGMGLPMAGRFRLSDFWQQEDLARDMVRKVLETLFPSQEEEDRRAEHDAVKEEYAAMKRFADLFADFLLEGDQPLVVIENLWINGLNMRLEDASEEGPPRLFQGLSFHATELSSNPVLYGKDSLITLANRQGEDPTFELELRLNWSNPDPAHHLKIRIRDLPGDEVLKCLNPGKDLAFQKGTIHLESDTVLNPMEMKSVNRFRLKGMEVSLAEPGKKILGFDGTLFCKGLTAFLKDTPLETEVTLTGPYDSLDIEVDDRGLIESVKQGILSTGDRLLQEQFDQQMEKVQALADQKREEVEDRLSEKQAELEEKLKDKAGEALGEEIGKGLDGILKGKEDDKGGLLDKAGDLFGKKKKKKKGEDKEK
jgi:uncharacterized protein (TIGR03546 family)